MNLSASLAKGPAASAHNSSVQYAWRSFTFFSFSIAIRAGGAMV